MAETRARSLNRIRSLLLTDEQRMVIHRQEGPLLVQAAVGSGKTLVLAMRAVEALERGLDPAEMLAITFTNRAARAMRERLAGLVGDQAAVTVNITTFHGLCVTILRRDGKELAIEPDFAIWDEVDRREAIRLAAARQNHDLDDGDLDHLVRTIGRHKQAGVLPQNWRGPANETLAIYREYEHVLTTSKALDFDDLVVQTWILFGRFPALRDTWAARCRWVEVDEFQDTSSLEYQVLRMLTSEHRNLCVFSDIQQSIYRWRGVDSQRLHATFAEDFPDAARLGLTRHFRSTGSILAAARQVVRPARERLAPATLTGVRLRPCQDERDERDHITRWVRARHAEGYPWSAIAVLAPWNSMVADIAQALRDVDVPVATVAATEFFRRPVVKAVTAYLRLIDNPSDVMALRRVADVPPRGLGPEVLSAVADRGRSCGLLLSDLLDEATHDGNDPCDYALAVAQREYVALDLECTGLDLDRDEPVEIALVRVNGATGQREEFRSLLRPARAVGPSAAVHGYSDADLRHRGRPPAEALAEARAFIERRPIVGHNIDRYDYPMLNRALARAGLEPLTNRAIDTLRLAKRVLLLDRYNLERVRHACGVGEAADHHALADARCAAACFQALAERLAATQTERRALVARAGPRFRRLALMLGDWMSRAPSLAVSELLTHVIEDSGYLASLRSARPSRRQEIETLEELRELAAERGLKAFLDYLSLARNADEMAREHDRVAVMTIHTAKGLEFDAVLLAGAHDAAFPRFSSARSDDKDEDRRLLYVGMTRARRLLEITYPETVTTAGGAVLHRRPSPFLAHLSRG